MAWPPKERRKKRRKRMNEEEKAMKERLFGLASDLKVPEKNGSKGDGNQERKKGCMVVCWRISWQCLLISWQCLLISWQCLLIS
jgi:hypothetical protein